MRGSGRSSARIAAASWSKASYLVNEFGPKGIGLAAELLGDTIKVVMATYFRPNNEEALLLYRKGR